MKQNQRVALALLIPLLVGAILFVTHQVTFARTAPPPPVITVDTLVDEADGSCSDGDCSLRDALANADNGNDIEFSVSGTIDLSTLGMIEITRSARISAAHQITVTGNDSNRLFRVTGGNITFKEITMTHGKPTTLDCAGSNTCGGAIYAVVGTSIFLDEVILQNNEALFGGAIYAFGSNVSIQNSHFLSNTSTQNGGAIALFGGGISVGNSTFNGNTALGAGGAVYSSGTGDTSNFQRSTFMNNSAGTGGALWIQNGTHEIEESTFTQNSATGLGGAISSNSELRIENSTISGNSAQDQGGGLANFSEATLYHVTLTGNTSVNAGAGIASDGNTGVTTTLSHSLIWGNTIANSADASDLDLTNGTIDSYASAEYNLIGSVGSGVAAFTATGDVVGLSDAMLGPLQDNGGSTHTHALLLGSPAIDVAPEDECESEDQRGVERPQSTACDIGAFELEISSIFVPMIVR